MVCVSSGAIGVFSTERPSCLPGSRHLCVLTHVPYFHKPDTGLMVPARPWDSRHSTTCESVSTPRPRPTLTHAGATVRRAPRTLNGEEAVGARWGPAEV